MKKLIPILAFAVLVASCAFGLIEKTHVEDNTVILYLNLNYFGEGNVEATGEIIAHAGEWTFRIVPSHSAYGAQALSVLPGGQTKFFTFTLPKGD